jgi:glycosyltransferase involved in cell wall biosynthesis
MLSSPKTDGRTGWCSVEQKLVDHLRRSARRRPGARPLVDLVVLLNGFPRLSETFVLQELLDFERRGLSLHVVALNRPEETIQLQATSELRASVEYLLEGTPWAQRAAGRTAHAALLLRRGPAYFDALADVLRAPDLSRGALAGSAILAHKIVRLGSPPLYVHFAHKPGTYGRFAARLAGVPYALSAHAKDVWITPPGELLAKARDAAVVLTCTDEASAYLRQLAGDSTRVHRIYHGVDLPRTVPAGAIGATPVVLSVARLVEKKGLETLIRASALLRLRGLDFKARIAGEGPEWARLQRLTHELSVAECVAFLGPLTEDEVATEYSRASVFALPCQKLPNGDRDGVPNVIVEAMARGLPIVSTTLPAVREAVVDGECGLLVEPGDARGLANALERLLTAGELRARFGARARERVAERFQRGANLPEVHAVLDAAGLIPKRSERVGATARANATERTAA